MIRDCFLILFLSVASNTVTVAQQTVVRGKMVEWTTNRAVADVEVFIENSSLVQTTDSNGAFIFSGSTLPLGEGALIIRKSGYEIQRLPIVINEGKELVFSEIYLHLDRTIHVSDVGLVSLSHEELDQEEASTSNISGLLQSSKDVFLQAAAFDFSTTFFNPRGYDSEHAKVLVNGIEMNKLFSGRPEWSNWGGLNDATQEQVFSMGMSPNDYSFGGLAGATNILMRASKYRKGGKISFASTNASYLGRLMVSYNTGIMSNGWAISLVASRRFGKEGYKDATLYESNSFFAAFERKISEKHSLNFTTIFTPTRRGKSSSNTQEVYDLKGGRYNAYWGWQDGRKRNSRIREVEEPIIMLNHYWDFNESMSLNTNLAYQIGRVGDSRLGYDNAPNPDPTYYQKLPSFFLDNSNDAGNSQADLAKSRFREDGQINWNQMYYTNLAYGGTSRYYLYEDRRDEQQVFANTIFIKRLDNILVNAAFQYRGLSAHNYANMLDLLGGNGYLDVDTYSYGDGAQSDLNNPDRIIYKGDSFKYNYKFYAEQYDAFIQAQFKYRKIDFYLAAEVGDTNYQRDGLYRNGAFADNSYGKSEKLSFTTYGAKGGVTYKITGRHLLNLNFAYYTKAPTLRNSFSNARQNNETVRGITEEKIQNVDLSYIFRSPWFKSRLTGYYTKTKDASQISFYYADGISGIGRNVTTAFVQEVLTEVAKQYIGTELGMEAQITPAIKLKAAAALGQYTYANNPKLYLTSDDFEQELDLGKTYLKNYKLSGGPQRAYQIGMEYRNPKYWWIGATANLFSHSYVGITPITRTKNFYMDSNGYPFADYSEEVARELLKQERFGSYPLVNLVGGKSWRVKAYYIGLFASINNVLNEKYKTGGFEQGRSANYKTLKEDVDREKQIFGSKYWHGNGATYYLNAYIRF
ncbi:MAG TPA: TonB-dependent receptor [Flavobacteriaceae bacterium]|nr:TonB-dependent receptor [Flavobacteriaceae bacterium]